MMRTVGLLVLLIIVAVVATNYKGKTVSSSPQEPKALGETICSDNQSALAGYLNKAASLGFIRVRAGRYEVDERSWSVLEHAQKVNLAAAAFCDAFPAGHGTVLLKGLHDGKSKASVVDGNYFDD